MKRLIMSAVATACALAFATTVLAQGQTQIPATTTDTAGHNRDVAAVAMVCAGGVPCPQGKSSDPFYAADANNAAFSGAVAMTVGTTYPSARSIGMICTAAGNVSVTFSDASTLAVPAQVGFQSLPFAVTAVNTSGTTATCTYYNLK